MNNNKDNYDKYASYLYASYRAHSGGKSLASGSIIPEWSNMEDKYKDAWKAVARASITYIPSSKTVTFKE